MSQNESTTVLVTDAKNLTLIDASRENSPWCWECLSECLSVYSVLIPILSLAVELTSCPSAKTTGVIVHELTE